LRQSAEVLEDIATVVFSHAHLKHIGVVVDANGTVSERAVLHRPERSDYWTDERRMNDAAGFRVHAR
jgi:glyoxylase-like metal-dependent hydrolase (beta-lactamase superfamily II)